MRVRVRPPRDRYWIQSSWRGDIAKSDVLGSKQNHCAATPSPMVATVYGAVTSAQPLPCTAVPASPTRAKVVESQPDRARIAGTLEAGGKVCATCDGLFVAVKEGHPAFHRW
jgi:hypothetical protein